MTDDCIWDVAVVGAGAAGLMTAIVSARRGAKVLLLDGQEKMGAKIIMSGGTRCNLTNQEVSERDFQSEKRHTVKNILSSFSSKKSSGVF
jgi:predicted flavoprotein YhiN